MRTVVELHAVVILNSIIITTSSSSNTTVYKPTNTDTSPTIVVQQYQSLTSISIGLSQAQIYGNTRMYHVCLRRP